MKNVYLFQPQYAVEVRNEKNYWLPYSAGCVWSYVSQFSHITDNFLLDNIFFRRQQISLVLEQLTDPVVCGFSCYLWNENYCLVLAEQIKKRWPDCIIVFGGPQPTDQTLNYWFIDSVIFGEGEESFLSLLNSILNSTPIEQSYNKSRLQELTIPSPYTTGVFDKIIKNNPNAVWAMSLETNRGCPFQCTFCDWGSLTYSKIKKFGIERVAEELNWAANNRVSYIFVADANFGIFKERDLEIAKLIRAAADKSMIESISVQYTKNSTDIIYEIAKEIGPYSKGITVSVQSMNEQTLIDIKRKNLDISDIKQVMDASLKYGVNTYTEMILGLPNETLESWKQGLTDLLELGQHQIIDVWFAQLLRNSEMASPFSRTLYGIKSIMVEDYLLLGGEKDEDSVREFNEIVTQTKTMSFDDIIESYMYAWMIIHFHMNGYTQIISRYARNVHGVAYRTFYDKLFNMIKQDLLFSAHYTDLREIVTIYLSTGKLPSHYQGGHALHSVSYEPLYNNKNHVYDLAIKTLADLCVNYSIDIYKLQKMFIYDKDETYPIELTTEFNLYSGQSGLTKYQVSNQLDSVTENFYLLRRKGLLKNKVSVS
jgi:uncharacterized protein YwgA